MTTACGSTRTSPSGSWGKRAGGRSFTTGDLERGASQGPDPVRRGPAGTLQPGGSGGEHHPSQRHTSTTQYQFNTAVFNSSEPYDSLHLA